MSTMKDWLEADPEHHKLFEQERLIVDVAEEIYAVMERGEGMSRAGLAQRLGKSKAFVTQILSGSRNLTLRTIADIAGALGQRVEIRLKPQVTESPWMPIHAPQAGVQRPPMVVYQFRDVGP